MKTANIGGIEFSPPIMNAAGTCKLYSSSNEIGFSDLVTMPFGAVVVGSITVQPRAGHAFGGYISGEDFSLNAMGLPNLGIDYYRDRLPMMVEIAHQHGKKLVLSVAADRTEYFELARLAVNSKVDLLELNLSCPNLSTKKGHPESIVCFDADEVDRILAERQGSGFVLPMILKVSPISDPSYFEKLARVIGKYENVVGVTAVNSFPNAWGYDDYGVPLLEFGLGGLSGKALKPIALGQVYQWWRCLPSRIKVIGVGGISTARDVLDYLDLGAEAVQVGSAFLDGGAQVVEEIVSGLEDD